MVRGCEADVKEEWWKRIDRDILYMGERWQRIGEMLGRPKIEEGKGMVEKEIKDIIKEEDENK